MFVLTLGTGIGSAPFIDGRLMPNTELGHMAVAGLGVAVATNLKRTCENSGRNS